MGRKATPTHLKLLSGNPGKRPINHDEPQVDGDLRTVPPPKGLGTEAKKMWKRMLENSPHGMLKNLDQAELMRFCIAHESYIKAYEMVKTQGEVILNRHGDQKTNPWLAVMIKQGEIMASSGSNLGFSPVSRSKIKIQSGAKPKSKFTVLEGKREA